MTLQHTPTPWDLNKYGELVDATGENIRAKGFALTNTAEAHANTAFIHRAVNAHDELVKALTEIADLTKRQQLPLTAQIHELASAALIKAAS